MNSACSQLGCACIVSGNRGRSFSMRVGPAKVIPFGDTNVTSANKFQKMKDDLKRKTSVQTEKVTLRIADVLHFMALNRKTKNRRKIERSLNVLNESFGSLIKPFNCCGFNY
ncbi:hypothetical protein V1477_006177 [Vespula maculifrons]|uniref:Uncharacterized protein n=1 Tax=Vespula maculifrons TaxID=7453 RepID=A0ABD2CKH2_VESMC